MEVAMPALLIAPEDNRQRIPRRHIMQQTALPRKLRRPSVQITAKLGGSPGSSRHACKTQKPRGDVQKLIFSVSRQFSSRIPAMRRILRLCAVLAVMALIRPLAAEPPNRDWKLIYARSSGKNVDVYTTTYKQRCIMVFADDTQLNCQRGKQAYTFARAEVRKVRLAYSGIFTVIGFALGTSIGAGVGYSTAQDESSKSSATLTGLAIGAGVGTTAGFIVDRMRQKTIYLAP
jgi:hypothetical protein